MKSSFFCGFNGFQQFGAAHGSRAFAPTELGAEWATEGSRYAFSWAFNAFTNGKDITISGFICDTSSNQKLLTLSDDIKSIAASDNYCLVLLNNGDLYRVNVKKCNLEKLNFTAVEQPHKRSIFGEIKEQNSADLVEKVASGRYISVAITRNNSVYNIPSKIYTFPKHVRIKSLVCGFEHALVLTNNGDVYSWGNGMRGQLGHPELKIEEIPKLIEALAGIKIVAISAGGWHSAAISSFGDLYVWGLNINGQLAITVYKTISTETEKFLKQKKPTVYHLPQVVDTAPCCENPTDHFEDHGDSCNFTDVVCGARHTFTKKSCGKIFCCGWNEHGQLGLDLRDDYLDCLTEFKSPITGDCNIYCGPWSTVFCSKDA